MTPRTSLRWRLRDATAQAHACLDARVGDAFADAAGYGAFLAGMHRFLGAAAVATGAGPTDDARDALARDLADLGLAPGAAPAAMPACEAGALGWQYVVAGASLGARLLLPRAQVLGFGPAHGARYLARQAAGGDWRRLLARLDAHPPQAAEAAIAGARTAFACAHHCMNDAFEMSTA